jgi:hypothetical protein
MTIRVALWTTGNIAKFAGRAVVDHPDLELVGAYSWSPAKAGSDVGTLIGIEPLGVTSTNDIDELIAMKPDVVGYYPIMNPHEVPGHVDNVCRLLEAGVNVVSSANIVTGRWWEAEDRLEDAGVRGNASLFGSGVNPGFVNQLLLTASGACSSVSKLSVWEEAECSGYASPELWETVAFGHPPDEPGIEEHFKRGISVFEDTVAMMADALDLQLDEIAYVPEVAIAKKDLDLGWMLIPEGTVAGLKSRWVGRVDGHDVIELGTIWKMTEDVEPNWEIRHGWHLQVDGVPTVKMHVAGWPAAGSTQDSEALMSIAMLMTAMPTIHAIPHVVRARPGVVTYKDLPLVTAAGCIRPA